MFKKLRRYLRNPYIALGDDLVYKYPQCMSDKFFLKTLWRRAMGYSLDLKNPKTFNEKLQWLKLYDHNPLYTTLVDKYLVKEWVAEKIGEQYIIPTLAKYDSVEEIDINQLPDQFVLKCNHDSGSVIICTNKSSFDIEMAKKKLQFYLDRDFYSLAREWPYKNVKRCIIAEQFMKDDRSGDLRDYKFFAFNGETKALFIASDRQAKNEETKFDFFDMNFTHLPITNGHPNSSVEVERPIMFDKMWKLANILSQGIPQVRVDFYEVNGKIYFGEMTLYHWGGMVPFEPRCWDEKFGGWITLPSKRI